MIIGSSIEAFGRSAIPSALVRSYLDTVHRLVDPAPLGVRAGRTHHGLRTLMKLHGDVPAAFLTAWNPESRPLSRRRNEAAQGELVAALDRRGLSHFRSWGHDALGADGPDPWPPEEGRVVLGLGLDEAARLGRRFGQNAIAWAGLDGLPLLVALR